MKYKQIIFDIDGTLIDTEYAVLHSLQDTLRTITGRERPVDELTFALGITGADALKRLEVEEVFSAIALWNENMLQYADTMAVFDGIAEVLETLSKWDLEMGIVTSKTKEEWEQDFCPFGIDRYFKTVVCADDTREHKPHPEPLYKYMEMSGADSSQLLYIGDSEYDGRCAESAGIDFALAKWGSRGRLIRAVYDLNRPAELLSVIQGRCE